MFALEYKVDEHVCVMHVTEDGDFHGLFVAKQSYNFENLQENQIQFSKCVSTEVPAEAGTMYAYERKGVVTFENLSYKIIEELIEDPENLREFVVNLVSEMNKKPVLH